ncbi:MAG: sulfatase-like hydrolase/transferase [Nannocystales bacterium]
MTTRRRFLKYLATIPACDAARPSSSADVSSGTAARAGLFDDGRPDIVFISVDDLNDWPTPFEGPKPTIDPQDVLTPNLEALAQQGTVFQRAYCAAPMCGPSRSATLTGLPPYVSGVTQAENIMVPKTDDFGPLLEAPTTTLPRLLHESGYRTYGAGKVFHGGGFGSADRKFPTCGVDPEDPSYDSCAWDDYLFLSKLVPKGACTPRPKEPTDISDSALPCPGPFDPATSMLPDARVARYGIDRLNQADLTEPMFLALGFFKPHKQWEAPQEFYDLYPDDRLAELDAAVERADQDDLTFTGCVTLRDARNSPPDATWDSATRKAIRGYLACVSYVDHLLGTVLDAIAQRPRRTVVVLWSDHGYFMGEKRGWKKPSLYERATRVPLIIADTAAPTAQSTFKMASLMDLLPTVLDYANVPDPLQYGVSLRPLVEDADTPWLQTSVLSTFNFQGDLTRREDQSFNADVERCMTDQDVEACGPFVLACPTHPPRLSGASFALRTDRYRFIRYHDAGGFSTQTGADLPTLELYDLQNDPNERDNLLVNGIPYGMETLVGKLSAELDAKLG